MSVAVLQGVIFKASSIAAELPDLARESLRDDLAGEDGDEDTSGARDARLFLADVISGRALWSGTKGDVCSWTTISNYGSTHELMTALLPFFTRVCKARDRGSFGRPYAPEILVFGAYEQEYGRIHGKALHFDRDGTPQIRDVTADFAFQGD